MKLNLLLNNPAGVRSGYLNLDPFADGKDVRVQCDITDISSQVEENEAVEIIAIDVLNKYPAIQVPGVLEHWLSRLAHKGKFVLSVPDLIEVGRAIRNDLITIEEANAILYGYQEHQADVNRSVFTMKQVVDCVSPGYKILSKRIHDYNCVVTFERG